MARNPSYSRLSIGLVKEVSASFFAKKEAKKLLFTAGCGTGRASAHGKQKFFGSFFQKRTAFFYTL
jgi:hypothetical protein